VKPEVFVAVRIPTELGELLHGQYVMHLSEGNLPTLDDAARSRVRALVTNGIRGADKSLMDSFPNLEIISSLGIGLDALDLDAARARNIAVTNTPGVITDDVADLAMAMIMDRLRRVKDANQFVLAGNWSKGPFPLARSLAGKTVGIVGLGGIGTAVARRAEVSRMQVKWFGPRPKTGVPYEYVGNLEQLAQESDVLVVCCSGGAATHHLVNARVLDMLGPEGVLINVARGSVVDTQALVSALAEERIAGAALDVIEGQPAIPEFLLRSGSVLLTPHIGTATRETRARMGAMVLASLEDHFAGRPLQHLVRS
jgi:lactate dehydrogenase-like 2-hydroxyacid dehydrogenase